jgi:lipoyl(octanoyl) transferase
MDETVSEFVSEPMNDTVNDTSNETLKELNREAASSENLSLLDWGLIDYASALQRQMDLVDLVSHELARETLVFCSHPPVVTLGRGTKPGDVFGWTGEVVEINRGGRATYHGPSQFVVYPILDLNVRGRDLHRYMRQLESAIVATLQEFGISASGRTQQVDIDGATTEATGVWVGSRKIASIGIGVRKWITFHGLALNVSHDPKAFVGMNPCGFSSQTMISMEEILGAPVDRARLSSVLQRELMRALR